MQTSPRRASPDWYRVARVRCGERPALDDASGLSFAPELLPHLAHPALTALDPIARRTLLDRALARYLHGTSVLEVRVVNETAAELAHGSSFALDARERIEALQLYCDEAYHALLASDVLAALGVDEATLETPSFLSALDALTLAHARSSDDARTLRFLFTVVTETSISQSLAHLARSRAVKPALSAFVADHARDEARHATFFARRFARFWSERTESERARWAALLPALVSAFLAPEAAALDADLAHVGVDASTRAVVLRESDDVLWSAARAGARPVLACFSRVGLDVRFPERS